MPPVLTPIIEVILAVLWLYKWVVIIAVLMSWLINFSVVNTYNRFVYVVNDFVTRLTEPALRPIRRFVPNLGGIDLSPIVLLLIVWLIQMEVETLR